MTFANELGCPVLFCFYCVPVTYLLITGPPTHSVGGARLVTVAGIWRRRL